MPDLPRGTVTFLFTDLEGSTRLWQDHPRSMVTAVARHDALLQAAVEGQRGVVFKTVGDGVCAAFDSAPRALAAALDAQRALLAGDWSPVGTLRVRMALHAAEAEPRDGDYHGPPLNRVARLVEAGHGGQVLLSAATHELTLDDLPPGARLRDLGEHPLRDLYRPERVFQLLHPDLPADFPPLVTLANRPNNLPRQPTPLVGREQEVAHLVDLLRRDDVQLVTLTGPGGTGKTRLASQAAAALLDHFPDGIWFVDLAPLADPALVPSAVAAVLRLREAGDQPLPAILETHLQGKRLLLVLDNVEHVLEAVPFVARLLAGAPDLRMLATSRAPLRIRGEREIPVPPLGLPDLHRLPPVDQLIRYEAVRLFVARAQDARPDFALTNANAPAVAAICHRLDGLPLAIELAAARVKVLPPEALLARLEHRLTVLTGGARDLPVRQRTLRDAIAWSHGLLSDEERTLFRRLAVFAGGATIESIEAVTNPGGELDLFEGLASLVDKSLLRQTEAAGEPRFGMLETIRDYALERLATSDEERATRDAHALHFLGLAERAEGAFNGPEELTWMERLAPEHDNLRGALAWAIERGDAGIALGIGGALWDFWYLRGHLSEGQAWLERGLAIEPGAADPLRAKALLATGQLAHYQGATEHASNFLGQSLALFRELGDPRGTGIALMILGAAAADHGDDDRAEALLVEAAARFEESRDAPFAALTLYHLGVVALGQGNLELAMERCEEALRRARDLGLPFNVAAALDVLALVASERGNLARAAAAIVEALALAWEMAHPEGSVHGFAGAAVLAALTGQPDKAARLFGGAEGVRARIGLLPPALPERRIYERAMGEARIRLGEAAFNAAWVVGRSLPENEVFAEALAVTHALIWPALG